MSAEHTEFVLAARLLGYIVDRMGGHVEFDARDVDQFVMKDCHLVIDTPDEERRNYRVTAKR